MDYGDYYWGLYRGYYRDPFPNSLQESSSRLRGSGSQFELYCSHLASQLTFLAGLKIRRLQTKYSHIKYLFSIKLGGWGLCETLKAFLLTGIQAFEPTMADKCNPEA